MTRRIHGAFECLLLAAVAWHAQARAAPTTDESMSEQPGGVIIAKPPVHQNWYGLCNAPQGADAFPEHPVLVIAGPCENYQQYTSTGPSATDSNCGGYTVAFGPKGNLKSNLNRITLWADWGDTPLTQAQCAKAKLAAVAWGARCSKDNCSRGGNANWETIGTGPKHKSGTWNSVSSVCYIGVNFSSVEKKYVTLNVDIIATLEENGQQVRKLAKGKIHAGYPNGKCVSLPAKTATK